MGSQNCTKDPVEILEEALQAGITAFQFREKGKHAKTVNEKLALGMQLRWLCEQYNVSFHINDDVNLVEPLDADGIHVGQEDEDVELIRERFPDKIIGLSISNEEELKQSPIHLIDYIGAGSVYSTSTKEDAGEAVVIEWIKKLISLHTKIPVFGIGGIHEGNAHEVMEAGGDGITVISAITESKHIKKTVKDL